MKNILPIAVAGGLTLLAAAGVATAQQAAKPAMSGPAAQQKNGYRPGLGDLMTMTIQPRHLKIALAAKEKNWFYLAFEVHELQEAFDRVGALWPKFGTMPIPDMIKAVTMEPMQMMNSAIKDQSESEFADAYKSLTAACNTCHMAAQRPMVSIQAPDANTYPDQNFKPKP